MKKHTTKILVLSILLLSQLTQAQDWQWIKDGGSAENIDPRFALGEEVIDMVTDSDRNVYIIAPVGDIDLNIDGHPKTNYSAYPNPTDNVLASFTCDGTYRWSKIFGGGGGNDYLRSVVVDADNNVYVSGMFSRAYDHNYPNRIEDDFIETGTQNDRKFLYIAKFDTNGIFQWIVQPEEPVSPNNGSYELLLVNNTLQWFVTLEPGTYADGALVNAIAGYSTYKFAYDLDGNFIDATLIQDLESTASFHKYYYNSNNHLYYLLLHRGDTNATATVGGTEITGGECIATWNESGVFQWLTQNNEDVNYLRFYDMDFDTENNIYILGQVVGFSYVNFLGFTVTESVIPNFVLKLNSTATSILWSTYPNKTNSENGGIIYHDNKVTITTGGTGVDYTWGDLSIEIPPSGDGSRAILLASFDAQTGATLSLDKIEGTGRSTGTCITQDINGDFLVGGAFGQYLYDVNGNQNVNAGGNTDFFVGKFATQACGALSTSNIEINQFKLYPNPANNVIYITNNQDITDIIIYNVLGQEVLHKKTKVKTQHSTIDISKLSEGTYFAKTHTANTVESLEFIKK